MKLLLLPTDPNDNRNVMLEIRAGTGGDEAALWAAELLGVYKKYAQEQVRSPHSPPPPSRYPWGVRALGGKEHAQASHIVVCACVLLSGPPARWVYFIGWVLVFEVHGVSLALLPYVTAASWLLGPTGCFSLQPLSRSHKCDPH